MGNLRRVKKQLALVNCSAYYSGETELKDLQLFTEGLPKKRAIGGIAEQSCPECSPIIEIKKKGNFLLDFAKRLWYNMQNKNRKKL